jgi:hypothetical protein
MPATAKMLPIARAGTLATVQRPTKVGWVITSSKELKTRGKVNNRRKPAIAGMQATADTYISIKTSITRDTSNNRHDSIRTSINRDTANSRHVSIRTRNNMDTSNSTHVSSRTSINRDTIT